MKRLIAPAALLALLLTACAETGAQPLGPAPTSSPTDDPGTQEDEITYELWFNYDGYLFVTEGTEPFVLVPPGPDVLHEATAEVALEALLAGPTEAERAADLGSAINPGTGLLGVSIEDGVATANLDATFTDQETPAIAVGSLSQIVYTLTQFDFIDGVVFEVEGVPLTNFGGYELDGPQRRKDFEDQLPWILVESPGIGEDVSSPVTIGGTADVFEAVVSIEIRDQTGDTIASTFTTATCGSGCRGTYSTDVEYEVGSTQPGTIRVYEVSAMDGSPQNVVEIPVTLTA